MKSNYVKEDKKVPYGIWTPNAKVVCCQCHGRVFSNNKYNPETEKFEDSVLSDEGFADMNCSKDIKDGYAVTTCNHCKKEIQVYENIAFENNLVNTLRTSGVNAFMSQTGGMNSAVEIPYKNNEFLRITYDVCGYDEWLVCSYEENGDFSGESFETTNLEELLDFILKLDGISRI